MNDRLRCGAVLKAGWSCGSSFQDPAFGVAHQVRPRPATNSRSGFAATDALAALLIVSIAMQFFFAALTAARQAAKSAEWTGRANTLAIHFSGRLNGSVGQFAGNSGGVDWTVSRALDNNYELAGVFLCDEAISLSDRSTHKRYFITTQAICQSPKSP